MNLLGIQDALKNASDQQLIQLMRSPDSTTPSYLVVSELNRRKQMRMKQAEPPNRTVAEDLTKDERTYADQDGIRSLRMPGYEDEAQAAERNPDNGIEAMREGGIVRMQAGGRSLARPGSFYGTSMSDLEQQGINEDYERSMGRIETNFLNRQAQSGRAVNDTAQAIADIRSRISSGTAPERAIAEALPGYRNVDAASIRQLFGVNAPTAVLTSPASAPPATSTASPPAAVTPPANPPPAQADVGRPLSAPASGGVNAPAGGAPVSGPPAGGGGRGGGGAAAPAGSSIRALMPDGEVPNMQTIMERNLGLLPGMPQELLDRIRSSRTNESERRREAQNMALLEAGLRIAGSNNPRLLGAIGEGAAPAAQTYAQQLSQIRQDQRADLQTELAAAQFDLQRRYAAGQISATEYRTGLTELGAYRRSAMQIAAENARHGASLGSASADRAAARQESIASRRGRGDFTPEELATMSPELRAIAERQLELRHPRNADVSGMSPLVAALGPQIARLENRMEALGPRPPDTTGMFGSANPRAAQWDREMKALRDELEPLEAARNRALNGILSPRVNGPRVPGAGTIPPPPPGFGILP